MIDSGEKPVLRKVYHENGKLAHIAIENNNTSDPNLHNPNGSDFYISGDFCAVYDNKGMFKFMGGIENSTLKGKGSVLWDNNWCRVKKGFQRNIDLPLWTLYPNENVPSSMGSERDVGVNGSTNMGHRRIYGVSSITSRDFNT